MMVVTEEVLEGLVESVDVLGDFIEEVEEFASQDYVEGFDMSIKLEEFGEQNIGAAEFGAAIDLDALGRLATADPPEQGVGGVGGG